jgi:hypothetical protein
MLAHQGEELLIPALVVAIVLAIPAIRNRLRRRAADGAPTAASTRCAYCGNRLEPDAERCPACGFRVRSQPG